MLHRHFFLVCFLQPLKVSLSGTILDRLCSSSKFNSILSTDRLHSVSYGSQYRARQPQNSKMFFKKIAKIYTFWNFVLPSHTAANVTFMQLLRFWVTLTLEKWILLESKTLQSYLLNENFTSLFLRDLYVFPGSLLNRKCLSWSTQYWLNVRKLIQLHTNYSFSFTTSWDESNSLRDTPDGTNGRRIWRKIKIKEFSRRKQPTTAGIFVVL